MATDPEAPVDALSAAALAAAANRRKGLALIAALVAAGVTVPNKDANAQSVGDIAEGVSDAIGETLGEIANFLGDILELLIKVFMEHQPVGPPEASVQVFNEVLGELGRAGEHSLTLPGSVPTAIGLSWPDEAVFTSEEQLHQTLLSAEGTKARIDEAATLCATAADRQPVLATEDLATLALCESAGGPGVGSVTTQLTCIAKLISTNSMRLSQLIMMHDQLASLQCDGVVRDQAMRWQAAQLREFQRMPSDIPPPGTPHLDAPGGGGDIGNVPTSLVPGG